MGDGKHFYRPVLSCHLSMQGNGKIRRKLCLSQLVLSRIVVHFLVLVLFRFHQRGEDLQPCYRLNNSYSWKETKEVWGKWRIHTRSQRSCYSEHTWSWGRSVSNSWNNSWISTARYFRILYTDSKRTYRTTFYSIINSTIGTFCSMALIWMATHKDFIHRLKSWNLHEVKYLLSSFHLNGHTSGFHQ